MVADGFLHWNIWEVSRRNTICVSQNHGLTSTNQFNEPNHEQRLHATPKPRPKLPLQPIGPNPCDSAKTERLKSVKMVSPDHMSSWIQLPHRLIPFLNKAIRIYVASMATFYNGHLRYKHSWNTHRLLATPAVVSNLFGKRPINKGQKVHYKRRSTTELYCIFRHLYLKNLR